MCITNERVLSKPDKRVRWVWKAFLRRPDLSASRLTLRLYPLCAFAHATGFDRGKWLTADMSKVRAYSVGRAGFHAFGERTAAEALNYLTYDTILHVKVRNIIAENDQGDVRALEMWIPKQPKVKKQRR